MSEVARGGEDAPSVLPIALPIPGCDALTDHFDLVVGGFRVEIDYYTPEAAERATRRKGQEMRSSPDGAAFVFQVTAISQDSGRLTAGL